MMAGGSGSRMKSDLPKQFMELCGKPVIMHSFEVFCAYDPEINFVLVLPETQIDFWKNLCKKYNFTIPHTIANGGETRFHSVKNGLEKITDEGVVFIHDAVRPLVSEETIKNCFTTAIEKGNALPVTPVTESVREFNGENSKAVDRSKYRLVQTPQTFRVNEIQEAYRQNYSALFTDDASVLENTGKKIHLVEGNRENIKITYFQDLMIAETLINQR